MLTHNALVQQIRPLLHPMIVHFPIALLFASVALDWLGYWLRHPNLTRAGFYTLVLGALGAGFAALSGPDHATGDASVPLLLASHQNFASLTVALAVVMVAIRFLLTDGIHGKWAALYLLGTMALLAAVTLTGYYGGEMTYHHAVGVTLPAGASVAPAFADVRPLIPAKPFVALLGFLCVVGLAVWLACGRAIVPAYFDAWWQAVRRERTHGASPLWTLQRGRPVSTSSTHVRQPQSAITSRDSGERQQVVSPRR